MARKKKVVEAPKPVAIVKAPEPKATFVVVPNHYEFYSYGLNLISYRSLDPKNVQMTADVIKSMLTHIKKTNTCELMVHLVKVTSTGSQYYDSVPVTEDQKTETMLKTVEQIKSSLIVSE